MNHIFKFMDKHNMIKEGDAVAAGVSGGADSLCLLYVLMEYRKKIDFHLRVVHINHMLRKEAAEEAEYVKAICRRLGVELLIKEIPVKQIAAERKISEEEAGRMARYHAFNEALENIELEKDRKKIAVAHHKGDVAETMLFHLFRGTGIYGMTGILPCRDHIIRPLLNTGRSEIEEFLRKRGISWCVDATNLEDKYTRNKIRHHILAYADREINRESVSHVAAAAGQMAELRSYLEEEVQKAAKSCMIKREEKEEQSCDVTLSIKKMKAYHSFIQKQLLLEMMGQVIPSRKDIGAVHVEAVEGLITKAGNGILNLPYGLIVKKEYDFLHFYKADERMIEKKNKKEEEYEKQKKIKSENILKNTLKEGCVYSFMLNHKDVLEVRLIKRKDFQGIEEKKYTKFIDYDKINNCLTLRFRESGDYLLMNDRGQRKKLKEYFINEKIPVSYRGSIPLIADGDHIIWVVGHRISSYYKVKDETENILQLTVTRRNE